MSNTKLLLFWDQYPPGTGFQCIHLPLHEDVMKDNIDCLRRHFSWWESYIYKRKLLKKKKRP